MARGFVAPIVSRSATCRPLDSKRHVALGIAGAHASRQGEGGAQQAPFRVSRWIERATERASRVDIGTLGVGE